MNPLLSICIPTYNRCQRLDSLLAILGPQIENGLADKIEVVVSDNASADQTRKIGEKWAGRHSFIRYFRNSWNIGGDPNQLLGVERGTGRFAWILGDDDRVRENALAHIVEHLNEDVVQLFLNYRCVTLTGECLSESRLHAEIPDEITTVDLIRKIGYVTAFPLISSHIFHREKFLASNPKSLLKISPWYVLNMALIMAFHDQRCHLVRRPVLDYVAGNDRLPEETVLYVRVVGLLNTLRVLEEKGKIDADFLYGLQETGAGSKWTLGHAHYFREEIYVNLLEMTSYWALPGRTDAALIRRFIDRGPGFWDLRYRLQGYFSDEFEHYCNHRKPVIHYWHGKAWFPFFTLLLSSDDRGECEAFDQLAGRWPEEFSHEAVLVSRLPEESALFENLEVFMAPFRPHRSPSASLNSGFRKALGPRVFAVEQVDSPAMAEVVGKIEEWQVTDQAPAACLIFASAGKDGETPDQLLGLYFKREELVERGGFENYFGHWSRRRLIIDAAYRLRAEAWAVEGGKIPRDALNRWFARELPGWLRLVRRGRRGPFSEHGLNLTLRHHLRQLRK